MPTTKERLASLFDDLTGALKTAMQAGVQAYRERQQARALAVQPATDAAVRDVDQVVEDVQRAERAERERIPTLPLGIKHGDE